MRKPSFHAYGKQILAAITALFLVIGNWMAAGASENSGNRTVRAGIFYFDGYHMKDERGNYTGYGIDFLNLASQYSHLNFEYVGYEKSWNDTLAMLEQGEIDLVTSARITPEREALYRFSLPIGRNNTVLSIRADNPNFHTGDYRGYDGMTIGLVKGSSQNQSLEEFAREKGFSYQWKMYSDTDQLAKDLQNGFIDGILSSNLRKTKNEKTLDVIASDNFYVMVRKEDTQLLEEINYAIEQMNVNEGDWTNVLYYQYYGPVYPSALTFTEREKAYIADVAAGRKRITATAMGDRKPYSYVEDGKLKGILPDYFSKVMALAGLPYETALPKSREDYYAFTDSVDVVMDRKTPVEGMENAPDGGFYTNAYMTTGIAKVTRKGVIGKVRTVAVPEAQGGLPIEQGLTEGVTVIPCATREEALKTVLRGEADAAYAYIYTAQLFVNNDFTNSLHYSVENNARFLFHMYVSGSSDHELVTILNKCIYQMPSDALNELILRYTSYTPKSLTFFRYLGDHPSVMFSILFAIAVGMTLIIALSVRAKWNRKILKASERSKHELEEQLAIVDALSREYLNVYAINREKDTARIIKMKGYVTTGLKPEQKEEFSYTMFIRRYIGERVCEEDKEELLDALSLRRVREKLEEAQEYTGSYRIVSDGEFHNIQFTYIKMEGGTSKGGSFILAGFRNIDEMVRKEHEQREILAGLLAEAQHANKSKTTFLNNMSHDIRTPMNAIIGFTSLASTHIDNKELVQNYLDKIMTSSSHLLSLINDVLDMSRIESGKVKIVEREASLPGIIHDLQTIVQSDVKARQLDFRMDMLDVVNETIVCDKLRLNQVLLNLLSNAMKYTKPGGAVRMFVIQGGDAPEGYASYEFHIKDTGIGMSREFLKHLFEPFEREQTATVSGIQGTGLGLTITKSIVDMMKGSIQVESEVGRGTEFVVSFCFPIGGGPASPQSVEHPAGLFLEPDKGKAEAGGGAPQRETFIGSRILLVEDNELNQEIAKTILEEAGFVIDTADDGTTAVEIIEKEKGDTYDLILMDIQMPVMDGYAATKAIRAMEDPAKASIPIVAMTANAFDEDRKKAADAGMNGHIAKPIDVGILMETLKDILSIGPKA